MSSSSSGSPPARRPGSSGRQPFTFEVLAHPDWVRPLPNGAIIGRKPAAPRAAQAYTVRATDAEGSQATATMMITVGPDVDLGAPNRTASNGTLRAALPETLDPGTTYVVRVPAGVSVGGTLTDIRPPDSNPIFFVFEEGSSCYPVKLVDCENVYLIDAPIAATGQVSNTGNANIANSPLLEVQNGARRKPCYIYGATFRGWRAARAGMSSPGAWEAKRRADGTVAMRGEAGFDALPWPTDEEDDLTWAYTWSGARLNGSAVLAGCDFGRVRVGISYVGSRWSAVIDCSIHDVRMDATRETEWSVGVVEYRLKAVEPLYSGNFTDQEHRDIAQTVISNVKDPATGLPIYPGPRYLLRVNSFMRPFGWHIGQGHQANTHVPYESDRSPENVDPMLLPMNCYNRGLMLFATAANGLNLILRRGQHYDRCIIMPDVDREGGDYGAKAVCRFLQAAGSMTNCVFRGAIEMSGDAGDRFVHRAGNYNLDAAPWTFVFPNIFNSALDWDDPRDAVAAGQPPSAARFWIGTDFRAQYPLCGPDWAHTGIDDLDPPPV
jgi:hypothetical protein